MWLYYWNLVGFHNRETLLNVSKVPKRHDFIIEAIQSFDIMHIETESNRTQLPNFYCLPYCTATAPPKSAPPATRRKVFALESLNYMSRALPDCWVPGFQLQSAMATMLQGKPDRPPHWHHRRPQVHQVRQGYFPYTFQIVKYQAAVRTQKHQDHCCCDAKNVTTLLFLQNYVYIYIYWTVKDSATQDLIASNKQQPLYEFYK
jgi:hypothetical protein